MYMVDRGLIGILVDYYMGEYSPYFKGPVRTKLGDRDFAADLKIFMEALAVCVRVSFAITKYVTYTNGIFIYFLSNVRHRRQRAIKLLA